MNFPKIGCLIFFGIWVGLIISDIGTELKGGIMTTLEGIGCIIFMLGVMFISYLAGLEDR